MPLLSNGAVDKWRLEHGTLWRLLGLWCEMISRVFEAMIKHVEVCGGLNSRYTWVRGCNSYYLSLVIIRLNRKLFLGVRIVNLAL